jgi:methyl-galactoside transport system permease protein
MQTVQVSKNKFVNFLINYGVIMIMFILVIYTSLTTKNFLTANNILNTLTNMSYRLVIALGIAGCVITAGCDLSAGRMIGFAACISGTLLQKVDYAGKFQFTGFLSGLNGITPLNPFVVLLIVMLITFLFGCITGFFIAYLDVPPFIATLAMMDVVYGIGLIYTGAQPLGGYVTSYTSIATGKFLGLSYLIWISLAVAAITWFIFNMTRHGKYMYAIGGNPQAASVAGVPVRKTLLLIYAKAAAFYGLAGFMLGAKAGGASVNTGLSYEMEAIAACTIGGVSVTGGRGKVSSAFIGVAVFEFLKTALQFLGVDANAQYIAIGVVIFIAISLDIRKYVVRK